jgi:hypothetical protein
MSRIQHQISPDYTAICHIYYCESQILHTNKISPRIFKFGTRQSEQSASSPGRFIQEDRAHVTN